jgi:proteic killer suppression protein
MILSFKDKETERIWNQLPIRKLDRGVQIVALRKLFMIARAHSLRDLQLVPGNRLELLKGDRAGQYSIRINEKWRLCFIWEAGNAYEAEIADYH